MSRRPPRAPKVDDYRLDPLCPRIVRSVAAILEDDRVVRPVDVLISMGMLDPQAVDRWRQGQVPYLEREICGNFAKLSRLLRILRFHAHDLNLVPSETVYISSKEAGRGRLRFSKTGGRGIERAYSRCFVWPGKGPFRPLRQGSAASASGEGQEDYISSK